MVDDLTVLYPKEILPMLYWFGKKPGWLKVECDVPEEVDTNIFLPRTILRVNYDALGDAKDCPNPNQFKRFLEFDRANPNGHMLMLGYLEAGGVLVNSGPKLFSPTFEQFESMGYVDLHIPIADFRSPYPAFLIRIPNEWRLKWSRDLGIDVQRQPRHVLIRTSTTADGKVHIFCVLKYPEFEHYNVVTDQPYHKDLQSGFEYVANACRDAIDEEWLKSKPADEASFYRTKRLEYKYCTDAVHAALNCCLMMVNFGCKVGDYLDPRIHQRNNKTQDPRRFADFKSVDMVQNIVIRQTELAPLPPSQPGSFGDSTIERDGPLWEVKPHWRRGHWRRKPGWQEYEQRGEVPPRSFVRPTLVRRDRVVGEVGESSVVYRSR